MIHWLVREAMSALMPATADLPGLRDCDVDRFVAKMLHEASWVFWAGIVAGAVVFTVTPAMTVYVPLPSPLLSAAALDRHAYRISTTRLYLFRQSILLLKMGACMCWGADPAVRARFSLSPVLPDPGTWRP